MTPSELLVVCKAIQDAEELNPDDMHALRSIDPLLSSAAMKAWRRAWDSTVHPAWM